MSRYGLAVAILVAVLGTGAILVIIQLGDQDELAAEVPTTAGSPPATQGPIDAATTTTSSSAPSTTTTVLSTSTTSTLASTTSSSSTTTTTATTTSTTPTTTLPPFSSSITTPTAAQLHASWEPGCPVGPPDLRLLTLSHWNYAGTVSTGQLVVAAGLAGQVVDIFEDLYLAGFPIERMELVDNYGGSDDASMAANNTSAFNCRLVTGGTSYSEHSYGRAIDINPLVNPYVNGSTVLPPAGSAYADRSLDAPGMIHAGDEVVQAFAARGWIWGGTWSSLKDYQHFSTTGK